MDTVRKRRVELANRVLRRLRGPIESGSLFCPPEVEALCDFATRPDKALGAAQGLLDALAIYRGGSNCPLGEDVHTAIARLEELLADNHRNERDA
jgi:hypothetical protein